MTKTDITKISTMEPGMLDLDAPIYNALLDNPPKWWTALLGDPEIYIEIRKGNLIHAYYYGARIAEISYRNQQFEATCHEKYVEGDKASEDNYVPCLKFLENKLKQLKRNAIQHYVKESEGEDTSEKRIQGRLRIDNAHRYIDSEFAHSYISGERNNLIRFDLVAVEGNVLKVEELKRIGDSRLRTAEMKINPPEILAQMERYSTFMAINQNALCDYYQTLLKIKTKLGLPTPIGYDREKPLILDLIPTLLIKNLYNYSKMGKDRYRRINDIREILEQNKIKYYFLP